MRFWTTTLAATAALLLSSPSAAAQPIAAAAAEPDTAPTEAAEIHTFHCLHSCPMGAPATNDLVVREIYTLSSDDATKFADWVAYRVTKATIGTSDSRIWMADPWLDPAETLEPADYDGAPQALKIDRGHQAPLASFSATPQARDTNFLSNITPQRSTLNQASWMRLEAAERTLAKGAAAAVYVLTGPLYERPMASLPHADEPHTVPSGYWKVVAVEVGGTTRVTAFIFDQETARDVKYCSMRASIEDVERRSHLRLFPSLSVRTFAALDADLGCR